MILSQSINIYVHRFVQLPTLRLTHKSQEMMMKMMMKRNGKKERKDIETTKKRGKRV